MPEALHIKLTEFQLSGFAAIDAERKTLDVRTNERVTVLVAGHVDPASMVGWDVKLVGREIVCTPPADAKPE